MGRTLIAPGAADAPVDLAFLDRDGTINVRVEGYVDAVDRLELLPGAAEAVARLNAAGIPVVVVTNQRGLATGALTWVAWESVMSALDARLAAVGAHVDDVRLCPHERGTCTCRKPLPGLFEQALADAPWADPRRCVMIGDRPTDVSPARALGMRAYEIGVDVDSLAAAVEEILAGQ